jgi:protein-S-isoprenylcysteine O-methyltransferase Ste14
VRHPGYLAAIVTYLAIPVALGTLWALVPGIITIALTVMRTALEDKTLRAELPGYEEYAGRVRYRLLPGVW